MPNVLTTASTVLCDSLVEGPPPLHGGTVDTSSTAKLTITVASGPGLTTTGIVLTKTDIETTVVNCKSTDSNTGQTKCNKVLLVTGGEAAKLTVNGAKAMLDTLTGTTDGTPAGSLVATAHQSKLTAV